MKYSVCIDAVFGNRCSFTEAMKKVKNAGYEAIEFWSWRDKDIGGIERTARELGLEIAAFCVSFMNTGDAGLQKEYLKELGEAVRTAQKLNGKTLIVQAGWEYDSFAKNITWREHRRCFLDTMKKAAGIAEEKGITLVIEPLNVLVDHPGYHLSSSQDAFAVIDAIGSDHVKVLFDIYHQQITEGNLLMNITENIEKIGHFHAAGNPGRHELTKGEINYRHVFEEIARLGYDGYTGLEYMPKEDPVMGLKEAKDRILV